MIALAGQILDGDQQSAGCRRITEFVNEFHLRPF
jgi:hypothetical protein